jgi:DNA invertase Pin-like site-specific DNA recombinase
VLLVEQVDRLSRLTEADRPKLRASIKAKQVRVVSLGLPTSWQLMALCDEFSRRMFAAINAMMLDTLAAAARTDYEDRRRRETQGIAKAKAAGAYRGRGKRRRASAYRLLRGRAMSLTAEQRRALIMLAAAGQNGVSRRLFSAHGLNPAMI